MTHDELYEKAKNFGFQYNIENNMLLLLSIQNWLREKKIDAGVKTKYIAGVRVYYCSIYDNGDLYHYTNNGNYFVHFEEALFEVVLLGIKKL